MIRLAQIRTTHGETMLRFEFDSPDGQVDFNMRDVNEKLAEVRELFGRKATQEEAKHLIKTLIDQVRRGRDPFSEEYDVPHFEAVIGVDLEA